MRRYAILPIVLALLLVSCADQTTLDGPEGAAGSRNDSVSVTPPALAFDGTSSATLDISSGGAWRIESSQPWLKVDKAAGSGDAVIGLEVDRSGLEPGEYAAVLKVESEDDSKQVVVHMRFPKLTGRLTDSGGEVEASRAAISALSTGVPANLPPHEPGEVLVKLNEPMIALMMDEGIDNWPADTFVTLSDRQLGTAATTLAQEYGAELVEQLAPGSGVFLIQSNEDIGSTVSRLARDGRVEIVQPNWTYAPTSVPDDPHYYRQWHLESIGLPAAWDVTTGSGDVIVGVIDTPVDVSHPDLADRIVPGYDFVSNTVQIQTPAHNHGTHVAGIIGAAGNNALGVSGVNWTTSIMPLNVFIPGGGASELDVARAILFAAGGCVNNSSGVQVCNDRPADIVNMSLGRSNPNCLPMPTSSIFDDVVATAVQSGLTLVAAAGNDGCNVVSIPASVDGVIAVSATNVADQLTAYSNYGAEVWVGAPGGDGGGLVASTYVGGYGYMAGTSQASPHVAGVAALLKAVNPALGPSDIAGILAESAKDLGTPGRDSAYGHGRIDAAVAVNMAAGDGDSTPAPVRFSDFTISVMANGTVVGETTASATGGFELGSLAAGTYTVEAGNDPNGNGIYGEPGEYFGRAPLVLKYEGDMQEFYLPVAVR